jgi:beta-1,4-mannooligosaccharide/beta-1,4-mannosyl-N-acetylglucosamine phosphorylase
MRESVPEKLESAHCITRHPDNPVLAAEDIPYPSTLVFNAGVEKYQGKYVMVFRNEVRADPGSRKQIASTSLGVAFSDDGISWDVQPEPWISQEDLKDPEFVRFYDPRLTVIDGRCYMCFAVDTRHGLRGGVGVTDDFDNFDVLSLSAPDNRNMALFPRKINGKYMRLERPFPMYSRGRDDRFDTWFSDSPDLKYWGNNQLVLTVEDIPYANDKIGPGASPIETEKGWLCIIHTVDRDDARGKNGWENKWPKRYCAGVMLLDKEEPWKVISYSSRPLIAPEATYEVSGGFRNNVVFPGSAILEDNGQVKIYYGAADTVECLATAQVDDLLKMCDTSRS